MKVSELSERTRVPVGTIKFYLRERVLAPGERTSRTSAEYDESHVARIRLIRALTDVGGLGIAQVRRVVETIDGPPPERVDLLRIAQSTIIGATPEEDLHRVSEPLRDPEAAGPEGGASEGPEPTLTPLERAEAWVGERGWYLAEGDPIIARFARAWAACEDAGVPEPPETIHAYADHAEGIGRVDVGSVPPDAEDAVRRVVLGTLMTEPVLSALRLMAQREAAIAASRAMGARPQDDASTAGPGVAAAESPR